MRLFVAVLLLAPVTALAQLSISVFGLSKHSESGYCEVNPGLGVNYQITENMRFGHGRFRNSRCHPSNGTGFVYDPIKIGKFSFGIAALRLTGYRKEAVYVPLPVGSYQLDKKRYVDFFIAHKSDVSVAGAAWRIEF